MTPDPQMTLVLDSRMENLRLVVAACRGICEELALSEQLQSEVELCLMEALTNCVQHAYAAQAKGQIALHIISEQEALEFVIEDEGSSIPEHMLLPPDTPEVPDDPLLIAEGGRGLFILFQLMDQVKYERTPDKNRMTLRKKFPPGLRRTW